LAAIIHLCKWSIICASGRDNEYFVIPLVIPIYLD
jgi:hypothetical protein